MSNCMDVSCDAVPHRATPRTPRVIRGALWTLFAVLAGASGCATAPEPEPATTTTAAETSRGPVRCFLYECAASCNGGSPDFFGDSPFPGQACAEARRDCQQEGCTGACTIAGPAECTE